jgi:hypothetical protein
MAKITIIHEGLFALSLADLESLLNVINNGIYDGISTKRIEAEELNSSDKTWQERLRERYKLTDEIEEVIQNKIRTILL